MNFLSNWSFGHVELSETQIAEVASVLNAPVSVMADSCAGTTFDERLDGLYQKYGLDMPDVPEDFSEKEIEKLRTLNCDNRLSKNLTRNEIACKCGCGFDIVTPGLVDTFQAIRDYIDKAVHITSGARCPEHNAKVGGVPDSAHVTGEALDMQVHGLSARQFGEAVKILHAEGKLPHLEYCYLMRNAIHIGVDKKNRNSIWGW